MRNRFSIVVLLLLVFSVSVVINYAQNSNCADPKAYADMQVGASEQVRIKILKIEVKHIEVRTGTPLGASPDLPPITKSDNVYIKARVVEVKESKTGLSKGKTIKIYYTTNQNYTTKYTEKWEAINLPLPEVGNSYQAFLQQTQLYQTDKNRYVPAACSKSFVKVEMPNK